MSCFVVGVVGVGGGGNNGKRFLEYFNFKNMQIINLYCTVYFNDYKLGSILF
jgi:hypothetical protein